MRTIQIVNKSSIVQTDCLTAALAAAQQQIDHDFAPFWGRAAQLVAAEVYDQTKESVILMDDTDQADALGYHELVQGSEVPVGFVFVKTAQDNGTPWTSVFSHEVLEQLEDPFADRAKIGSWGQRNAAIADEVCDAVENDGYQVDGVSLSNFVMPAWFDSTAKQGTQVDFLGVLNSPCTLRPGGFISVTYNLRAWKEVVASAGRKNAYRTCPKVAMYSRKSRRAARKAA